MKEVSLPFKENRWCSLLLMIKFKLSIENYNFKELLSATMYRYFPTLNDFSGEISGDINKKYVTFRKVCWYGFGFILKLTFKYHLLNFDVVSKNNNQNYLKSYLNTPFPACICAKCAFSLHFKRSSVSQ